MTFFIFSFLTPNLSLPHTLGLDDDYSKSEIERFQKYGFEKKVEQAEKVKKSGIFFWFFIIILIGLLVAEFS